PQYWGMVFPLGMYTAATFRLSQALPYPPLAAIAKGFYPLALVAWFATALGWATSLAIRKR
ncbi:MAG: C4-dicarboxylate ABC transporter, partial [Thermoanaerobaculia bacterium]